MTVAGGLDCTWVIGISSTEAGLGKGRWGIWGNVFQEQDSGMLYQLLGGEAALTVHRHFFARNELILQSGTINFCKS